MSIFLPSASSPPPLRVALTLTFPPAGLDTMIVSDDFPLLTLTEAGYAKSTSTGYLRPPTISHVTSCTLVVSLPALGVIFASSLMFILAILPVIGSTSIFSAGKNSGSSLEICRYAF